jgi:hypothetical protein
MAMSSGEGDDVAVVTQEDDLSRQRRKRAARLLGSPRSRLEDNRVQAVLADALAAIEQRGDDFDVQGYLVDHGHGRQTVQTVLAHLGLGEVRHPSRGQSPWRGAW